MLLWLWMVEVGLDLAAPSLSGLAPVGFDARKILTSVSTGGHLQFGSKQKVLQHLIRLGSRQKFRRNGRIFEGGRGRTAY